MVWTLQPDGRVDYLNRGWLDYTGLSLAEALEDGMRAVHLEDRAPVIQDWSKSLERKAPFEREMRLRRADGQYRWFIVRTVPALNAEGSVFRWYGTCIDIEDRKRAAEAVRENQQLLLTVLETLPVGVAVMDAGGDIVLNNAFSKKIWEGQPIRSAVERLPQSKGYWHDSGKRLAPDEWASVRALADGRPVLAQLVDIEAYNGRHKTLQNSAAPIRDANGTIIGAVVVNEDVTDRINAEEALRDSAERLQKLSRRLLTVQEEERRHLSRELHDEFGQLLSAISMHLHIAKSLAGPSASARLADADALVQQAGERVRTLALELRPSMLDGAGLEGTLRWLAEQHTRQGRITVTVTGTVAEVPSDVAITCFRIVQEALTNVVRHAGATNARIQLQHQLGWLRVAIEDDGIGFDVVATRAQAAASGHLGLTGMRERAEILGGHVDVISNPQAGTRVSVSLPLPAAT